MTKLKAIAISATLGTALLTSACGSWWLPRPHKIDIQQGNLLDENVIASLAEGMSKAEVRSRIGNPLLAQVFRANRWDYVYSINKSGREPFGSNLTLFFENGVLAKIERNEIGQ